MDQMINILKCMHYVFGFINFVKNNTGNYKMNMSRYNLC